MAPLPTDSDPLLINGVANAATGKTGDDLLLEGAWSTSSLPAAANSSDGLGLEFKKTGAEDDNDEVVLFDPGLKRRAVLIIAILVGCNIALIASLFIIGAKNRYPGV